MTTATGAKICKLGCSVRSADTAERPSDLEGDRSILGGSVEAALERILDQQGQDRDAPLKVDH